MRIFSSLSQQRKRIVDISVIKVLIKKYMTLYTIYIDTQIFENIQEFIPTKHSQFLHNY